MGAHHSQRGAFLQIDFMKRIVLWFSISGAVILISFVSLGVRGLNLGIDFKGGVQITFKTAKPTSLETVRDQTARDRPRPTRSSRAAAPSRASDSYKSFQIRLKKLSQRDQAKLQTICSPTTSRRGRRASRTCRRASAARSLKSAIYAIIVSLLIITLYIAIRFKGLAFAVPVIVALLHDILITVGVYSLTGREVTESTVAAVLTVLGYSIYDTIIIFDRIRENIPIMRRASFATIVNVSLWETIRRSLATTFITLLPVAALFFFGGATLKDFAFALLVGIDVGRVLVDLHRGADRDALEAARARVRTAPRDDARGRRRASHRCRRQRWPRPRSRRRRRPVDAVIEACRRQRRATTAAKRERRRQRRQVAPAWARPLTTSSASSSCSGLGSTSSARSSTTSARAGAATPCAWARGRSGACRTSRASWGS